MVAVPIDDVMIEEKESVELEPAGEPAPEKKSYKERLTEYEAVLNERTAMIIRHVRYQCVEFWHVPNCPETWAIETIDLIEEFIDRDFQRMTARRVMDESKDMPLDAKKYLRKYFDLWT